MWHGVRGRVAFRGTCAGIAAAALLSIHGCADPESQGDILEPTITVEEPAAELALESLVERALADVELTSPQRQAVAEIVERYRSSAAARGTLWYMAAELEEVLGRDQVDAMRDGIETRGPAKSIRGWRGLELTEQQQKEVRAVLERHREELRSLRQEVRGGDVSREEARERAGQIRETIEAEILPILDEEQRERWSAAREQRGQGRHMERKLERRHREGPAEVHEAMRAALELTGEQAAALAELAPGIRRSGWQGGDRAEREAALREILTDDQLDVLILHRALSAHVRGRGWR